MEWYACKDNYLCEASVWNRQEQIINQLVLQKNIKYKDNKVLACLSDHVFVLRFFILLIK
jgi:hypothetical protein